MTRGGVGDPKVLAELSTVADRSRFGGVVKVSEGLDGLCRVAERSRLVGVLFCRAGEWPPGLFDGDPNRSGGNRLSGVFYPVSSCSTRTESTYCVPL